MASADSQELRDAAVLAGVASGPSASAGTVERPSCSGSKRKSKARKPYTITKQREKWTDREHLRFLEALRLYGRAWRRIEEHIGSKTAVQVRSHAQKFFSKLERQEAAGIKQEGLPDDVSIPPPRPKRKPSHPYPKKPFSGSMMSTGTEGGCSQDMPPPRLPDYSHLAPKNGGNDRLDVAVAAVAQAASAAAAAAAAAVISAAGDQIRAHMQACPPQGFPFFGLPPSMLAQLSLQHLRPQTLGAANAATAANPLLQSQYPSLAAPQAGPAQQQAQAAQQPQQQQPPVLFMPKAHHHPMKQRLHDFARTQMCSERTGTSGELPSVPRPERQMHKGECYSACSREDNGAAGEGRLPGDTGATSANPVKGLMARASTWAPGSLPAGCNGSTWSPDVLAGLYYGWNMAAQHPSGQPAGLVAQQGAAADLSRRGTPGPAGGPTQGDWRSVVQAAAAAASQLEISKLSGSKSAEVAGDVPLLAPPASLGKAETAPPSNFGTAQVPARFTKVQAGESKAMRCSLSGSDGSGTNGAKNRSEATKASLAHLNSRLEDSPSRDSVSLQHKEREGSLNTSSSGLATGMKEDGAMAYQADAEGEGSGSAPAGNGSDGNNGSGSNGEGGKHGSNMEDRSGSGNDTDEKDGSGMCELDGAPAEAALVRESTVGNEKAGTDNSGKGSGNASQGGAGVTALEGPGRREGSEEGSAEGCTSQEHPKLPSWAAAGSRLEEHPSSKEFSAFAGPQGIIDAAQMAQAASALRQSVQQFGLGPYFMQHAYAPQLAQAQLQQAAMMNWGKQSAFDMFSNLMTFQALASQQGQTLGAPTDHPAVILPLAPQAGDLASAPSKMASYDTMIPERPPLQHAPAPSELTGVRAQGLTSGLVAAPGYNGIDLQPLAAAAQGMGKPGMPGHTSGFMPYKWHAQQGLQQPVRGAQQLPMGALSLGKRAAPASLVEPPCKRAYSTGLP